MATASGPRQLTAGQYLFREGDPSDACYVVKAGKIAITKTKGNNEIELAELKNGQMFGEMAFFDNKPRSASAKAKTDVTVICLPFASLTAQFKAMPEWLKAMIKTINDHLRDANMRIKNLESAKPGEEGEFSPYRITKLCAILGLVANKYAEKRGEELVLDYTRIRNYTIQVFQEPTNKMDKMMAILSGLAIVDVRDLGEGRKEVVFKDLEKLLRFVDFYNTFLFKEESKRINVDKKDMKNIRAMMFYGSKETPDAKGKVKINLTQIQNESMKDLGFVLTVNDWEAIISKKISDEKTSEANGVAITFDMKQIEDLSKNWEIVFAIEEGGR
jgi:CRP-like cAMP-binding protein